MLQNTIEELNELFLESVSKNDKEKAENYLSLGADLNAVSGKGNSALMNCVNRNYKKMFDWLLYKGINVNIQDITFAETALMLICKKGKTDYLESLLDDTSLNLDITNTLGVTALHYACMYKHVECAQLLIDAGASYDKKTQQKTTPILTASESTTLTIIQTLIHVGGNVNDTDFYGKSLLMNSVQKTLPSLKPHEKQENDQIVKLLLESGADYDYVAPGGITAIFIASMYQQLECVEALLQHNANPNVSHDYHGVYKITPLHWAMESKNYLMASLLLEKGADINAVNSVGNQPASFGYFHPNLRELTLNAGGDVNSILHHGEERIPSLTHIITSADNSMFDKMVDKGVCLSYADKDLQKYQPLKLSIQLGLQSFFNKILDKTKANINELWEMEDGEQISPLMLLVKNENASKLTAIIQQKKYLESLLSTKGSNSSNNNHHKIPEEKRAEIEAELSKFKNIEEEIKTNKLNMYSQLINAGAKVDFEDNNGKTALFYVNDNEFLDLLIKSGANIFHKDKEGNIPLASFIKDCKTTLIDHTLQYLIENNLHTKDEIKSLLLDMTYTAPEGYHVAKRFLAGVNHTYSDGSGSINYQDVDGNTPLIVAAATSQGSLASLLIDKGAEVNLSNILGETALMHAIQDNNPELVEYLIKRDADCTATTNDGKTVLEFANELGNKEIWAKVVHKLNPEMNEEQLSNVRKVKA